MRAEEERGVFFVLEEGRESAPEKLEKIVFDSPTTSLARADPEPISLAPPCTAFTPEFSLFPLARLIEEELISI